MPTEAVAVAKRMSPMLVVTANELISVAMFSVHAIDVWPLVNRYQVLYHINSCRLTMIQETCRDVPHKKRGRPRLREDTEFQVETSTGQLGRPFEQLPTSIAPPGERPIAAIRHRRGDSLRTLRSYGSSPSSSSIVSPTYGRPASRSIHEVVPPVFVTPIAFLDLDLVIIRANAAFYQLFAGSQELRGRRLTDIARPADADSFQNVRNSLREEREAKEPAYLPPILQSGHDPLSGTTEGDVQAVTRGFEDRQYMWTYGLASGVEQALQTRICLAKSSIYFVTLTLPPFPQARLYTGIGQAPPSPTLTSPLTMSGSGFQTVLPLAAPPRSRRNTVGQSAPPSPFYPYQSPMYGPSPSAGSQGSASSPSSSRTHPPPHQHMPYAPMQYPQYRSPPFLPQMQPVAEPMPMSIAPASDPFAPRYLSRRLSQPLPPPNVPFGGPQPIQQSPLSMVEGHNPPPLTLGRNLSSSSGSGRERTQSPKKRRRMEIGDVLQK